MDTVVMEFGLACTAYVYSNDITARILRARDKVRTVNQFTMTQAP